MNKLACIGEPFYHEHSSCSDLTPTLFRWSRDLENCDTVVTIDSGIVGMFESEEIPENRFAWLCESPVVIENVYDMIRENHEVLLDYYTAIFTCDKDLADKHERIHLIQSGSNLPWIKDGEVYNKSKDISIVASNKNFTVGQKKRHELIENHRDSFDVIGSINGERVGGLFDKLEGYKDYRFTIVIENCNHDNYYTEKITDAFATGTIPVYWGTDNVFEVFNPDGIIRLTDDFDFSELTEELYQEKLDAVKDNFERVNNLKMADDELYEIIQTYS